MSKVVFEYRGAAANLKQRQLLGQTIETFHTTQIRRLQRKVSSKARWTAILGDNLLFDSMGLDLIQRSLSCYKGSASELQVVLRVDQATFDNYFSLIEKDSLGENLVRLPLILKRKGAVAVSSESLFIDLPVTSHEINYPRSLADRTRMSLPSALLMPFHSDFDLLFANQIALISHLRWSISRTPLKWIQCLWSGHGGDLKKRISLGYKKIHPTAQVHPTAVIEGSFIGPEAHVGAHCVVRYSYLGRGAKLHDGSKVEFSVVGDNSWLMHDLVLYRSSVEDHVFLIHGPYQFSYFESKSSAFATIMMDYRPDGRAIQVKTREGLCPYRGRFLGSYLKEGSKVLGGCLLAPGRIVPNSVWLSSDNERIHTVDANELPIKTPLAPDQTKRKTYEPSID